MRHSVATPPSLRRANLACRSTRTYPNRHHCGRRPLSTPPASSNYSPRELPYRRLEIPFFSTPASHGATQKRQISVAATTVVHSLPHTSSVDEGRRELLQRGSASRDGTGPIHEYDTRVSRGLLRNDEHQRGKSAPFQLARVPRLTDVQASFRACKTCTTS